MLPRDRGIIIQVGSALAYRGIPLQSAYCAAKHAIQGFCDSLRCELIHDGSNVRLTMVQMPAMNTPQFGWVKSRLPRKGQPVPPIFQPEVAARAIVWAAFHDRREIDVGWPTVEAIVGNKLAVHRCSTVALLSLARARTPLDDHWCFRLRSLACVHFAQPDPLLSSWMSSSPAYTLQDFPVLADLASEHTAGPSLTQTPGNRNGGSVPANHAPTAASKYSNTDRPCCVQVAITVQIRSHQRFPFHSLYPA